MKSMEGNTGKKVIGSYRMVYCFVLACLLSYRNQCAVMLYSVMLYRNLGPVSRKSRKFVGTEKPVVELQSACFEKLHDLLTCF